MVLLRCPRCRFSFEAAEGTRCGQCGGEVVGEHDLDHDDAPEHERRKTIKIPMIKQPG